MRDSATEPTPPVRIGSGSELTWALFVRDRFALPSAASIPALDPPVVARPASGVPDSAWDQWWTDLLARDSLTSVNPSDTDLAALVSAVDEEARCWEEDHVTFDPPYVPMWISDWLRTHRLTSPVQVFVVGVGGAWDMQVGPGRALVSIALYQDHVGMDTVVRNLLDQNDGGRALRDER